MCLKIELASSGTSPLRSTPQHAGYKVACASRGYRENRRRKENPSGTRIVGSRRDRWPVQRQVQVVVQVRRLYRSPAEWPPARGTALGKPDFLGASDTWACRLRFRPLVGVEENPVQEAASFRQGDMTNFVLAHTPPLAQTFVRISIPALIPHASRGGSTTRI